MNPPHTLLSLAHFTVIDADPLALIDAAAFGGYDAIGLRTVPPFATDTIVPVVGVPQMQKRIKQRLSDTGVQLLDIEAFWLKSETQVADLIPALACGADLGARYVLVVGFDGNATRLADNFAALCDAAHACGLRAMLEFIPYATVRTLQEAHSLLAATKPANAGLLVDALHLSRSGGHPSDIAAYDPALFSYVHLCDAPATPPPIDQLRAEARGQRSYPGEGGLWLDAFMAAFPAHTPVAIEAPRTALDHLSPNERARMAADAARRVLARSTPPPPHPRTP